MNSRAGKLFTFFLKVQIYLKHHLTLQIKSDFKKTEERKTDHPVTVLYFYLNNTISSLKLYNKLKLVGTILWNNLSWELLEICSPNVFWWRDFVYRISNLEIKLEYSKIMLTYSAACQLQRTRARMFLQCFFPQPCQRAALNFSFQDLGILWRVGRY